MKKIVFCITVICCLTSFSLGDKSKEFKKLHALEGTWKMNGKRGAVYEEWKKVNDNLLRGRSYFLRGTDTLVTEHVSLTNSKAGIFYTPAVEDQNNKQPIPFKMTKAEGNAYYFENPEHDFPKRIVYNLVTADSVHVYIDNGTEVGKRQNFHFKRQ